MKIAAPFSFIRHVNRLNSFCCLAMRCRGPVSYTHLQIAGLFAQGAEGSRDDALLHGVEFQGDRRTDRGKHQYLSLIHISLFLAQKLQ